MPLSVGAQEQGANREQQSQGQQQEARRPRPEAARETQAAAAGIRHPSQRAASRADPVASLRPPGSVLTDQQGDPQAESDLSPTPGRCGPGDPAGHIRGEWRPGGVLGLSPPDGDRARGGCRSMGRRSARPLRRPWCPMPKPGSISRISCSSILPEPATAAWSAAIRCANGSIPSREISTGSPPSSPAG